MVYAQIKSLSCLASGDAPFEGEESTVDCRLRREVVGPSRCGTQ